MIERALPSEINFHARSLNFAPGRVTHHHIMGAILLYLTIVITFVALFALLDRSYHRVSGIPHRGPHRALKLNLVVLADREPPSASSIRRSGESPTMDCDHSKLNGTVFGMHDWPDSLRGQAAMYRKLAEQIDDPFVKNELLELVSVCEEVADNIEDHLTGESAGPNAF